MRNIKNIAIIAHVDHGKTTMVDKLLQASGTFRENEEIVSAPLEQVTIFNESQSEINLIINGGEVIPLEIGESLSFGDIIIESIVIVEKGSIVKYIGI